MEHYRRKRGLRPYFLEMRLTACATLGKGCSRQVSCGPPNLALTLGQVPDSPSPLEFSKSEGFNFRNCGSGRELSSGSRSLMCNRRPHGNNPEADICRA
jgi:hypothetical protein